MYVNYVNDRRQLGYKVVKDTNCGIELVLITESTILLIRNLSLNLKGKSKRIVVVISLATVVWFSNLESVSAIGLPIPPAPVVRLESSWEGEHPFEVRTSKMITKPNYRIDYKSKIEILLLYYGTDPRLSLKHKQVLKNVSQLRGGSWVGILGSAAFLGWIILIFTMGEGFVPNNLNVGWGLDRPNPFQPPTAELRYPPYYDLFFPRRTCYADRPGGSQIMGGVNPQSSREELTQLSNSYIPTKSQINQFVKNGQIDLRACYAEVLRRADQLSCEDFESVCSFERFESLATECNDITPKTAREAITILQGEMHGYYKNARRVDYGPGIEGLDFAVDGLGEFENITHADAKNAVGSAIKIAENQNPNIRQQGRNIGKKALWQKKSWSNRARTSKIPNIKSEAYLPQSVNNTLTVVDCFDVPTFEKSTLQEGFNSGSKNDTNSVFLKNVTNI